MRRVVSVVVIRAMESQALRRRVHGSLRRSVRRQLDMFMQCQVSRQTDPVQDERKQNNQSRAGAAAIP